MSVANRMDKDVQEAVKIYGQFLNGEEKQMDDTVISAIRTIREYVYLRNPNNQEAQDAIITAKWTKMSGADLEALLKQL